MTQHKIATLLAIAGCLAGGASAKALAQSTGAKMPQKEDSSGNLAPGKPMALGVATHFAQGWNISAVQTAKTIGAGGIRDELSWSDIEKSPGTYKFSTPNSKYLDAVDKAGLSATILLQGGNANYDSGFTPWTDSGRLAFAKFAAAVLDRFPAITALEIGNEFNSSTFVSGPVKDAGYGPRQEFYAKLLKTVYDEIKRGHPRVKILGGAAHSIPVGYFKVLFGYGALDTMDGIVIHPYTTEPEQLARQLAVLNTAMGAKRRAVYATEFDREVDSAAETADYLVKMASVMAATGVAGADWYSLRQEGPAGNVWYKNAALSYASGPLTQPGEAFKNFAQNILNQGPARRIVIDDFTYGYAFGDRTIVLWGTPRTLDVSTQASFYDSRGIQIAKPGTINPTKPLIIVAKAPLILGENLRLGASHIVADSFDQFDYANNGVAATGRRSSPWSYYSLSVSKNKLAPLSGFGGGEIPSSSWTPYITDAWQRPLAITANSMNPVDFGHANNRDVIKPVTRYTSTVTQTVSLRGTWDVQPESADGVDLTVTLNGIEILATTFKGHYDLNVAKISLAPGDKLDFVLGPNATIAGGDATVYRVQLTDS